jgi:hypothetical protein
MEEKKSAHCPAAKTHHCLEGLVVRHKARGGGHGVVDKGEPVRVGAHGVAPRLDHGLGPLKVGLCAHHAATAKGGAAGGQVGGSGTGGQLLLQAHKGRHASCQQGLQGGYDLPRGGPRVRPLQ